WAEQVHQWSRHGLARFARRLRSSAILRLTLRDSALSSQRRFSIATRPAGEAKETDRPELVVSMDWVDALVFPSGIGFLILRYGLEGEQFKLSQLIGLNRAIRLVHPPTINWALPRFRFDSETSATVRGLMNFLVQGLAGPMPASGHPRLGPDSPETGYTESE